MANLSREFGLFNARISVTTGNMVVLRMAREAIRERIRRYFRETLQVAIPKFQGQGAYNINTLVNPINGEYDIDDGVFLQHLDCQSNFAWPAVETVHRWLVNSIDGIGAGRAETLGACVRVRYRGLYRVDLPVYAHLNGKPMLAIEGKNNWICRDPKALSAWFNCHVSLHGEQLRRVVRYIKAWADYQTRYFCDMPSGVIMTVLATRYFHNHDRDDVSMAYTLKVISNAVCPVFYVPNPVDISEELTTQLNHEQKRQFQKAVKSAYRDALEALMQKNPYKASMKWRNLFGDRFPRA